MVMAVPKPLELGAFSVSLGVKDLGVSRAFYESLGFEKTSGGEGYMILRQGTTVIGLFQGMFDGNILTFNPGLKVTQEETDNPLADWRVQEFTDIREIQHRLREEGVELDTGVDEAENPSGPASIMLRDPDGNAILIDQFFAAPGHEGQSCDE